MFKTDNSLHVFVGPNSATEDAAFQNDVTAAAATGSGSIFVVNETGAAHSDAIAAGEFFKIGQKNADGTVSFSPLLEFNNCTFTGKATVARSQQNSVFGSNGSTGSIDAINSNRYTIRVNFKNNTDLYSEQSDLHFFEYVSDASATQIEVADYFAQTISKSEKLSGKRTGKKRASVKVERFTDAADSTISTDITSIAFTNGSKVGEVVFGSGSDLSGIVVGNYLRITEDSTTDVPVATTDAIYKVVATYDSGATTGSTVTLDQAYQGTSLVHTDPAVNQITAAVMASANVGLKITGLAQEFKLGLLTDSVVSFDVNLDGFGSTTALATTAAVKGSGIGNEISELEWFGKGSQGAPYRHGVPNNTSDITLYASTAAAYDVLEIKATLADPGYAVAGAGTGKCSVVLALVSNTNTTDGAQANTTFGLTAIFSA